MHYSIPITFDPYYILLYNTIHLKVIDIEFFSLLKSGFGCIYFCYQSSANSWRICTLKRVTFAWTTDESWTSYQQGKIFLCYSILYMFYDCISIGDRSCHWNSTSRLHTTCMRNVCGSGVIRVHICVLFENNINLILILYNRIVINFRYIQGESEGSHQTPGAYFACKYI